MYSPGVVPVFGEGMPSQFVYFYLEKSLLKIIRTSEFVGREAKEK
jgi:hypothetical protein